jgi:hypothetical protein
VRKWGQRPHSARASGVLEVGVASEGGKHGGRAGSRIDVVDGNLMALTCLIAATVPINPISRMLSDQWRCSTSSRNKRSPSPNLNLLTARLPRIERASADCERMHVMVNAITRSYQRKTAYVLNPAAFSARHCNTPKS